MSSEKRAPQALNTEVERLRKELAQTKAELVVLRARLDRSMDGSEGEAADRKPHSSHPDVALSEKHEAHILAESPLHSLMEATPNIVLHTDLDLNILYLNRTFSGKPPRELLGINLTEILDSERLANIEKKKEYVLSTRGTTVYEEYIEVGPTPIHCSIHLGPVYHGDQVSGLLFLFIDDTKRKQAEKALKESEELYRSLVDMMPDTMTVTQNKRVVFANPAATQLYGGRQPEKLLGTPLLDLIHTESKELVAGRMECLSESFTQNPPARQTLLDLDKVGHEAEIASKHIMYKGEPAILSIGRDVTQQVKAERALRASEEKFRSLAEHSGAGISYFDLEGRFLFLNEQAAAYYGKSPAQCLGKSVDQIVDHKTARVTLQRLKSTVESSPGRLSFEDQVETPQGLRSIIYDCTKVMDDHGRISGVQIISRDITRLRNMQQKLADNEAFLQAVFDNAGIGIYVVDVLPEGGYYFYSMNSTHDDQLDWKSHDFVGRTLDELAERLGRSKFQQLKQVYDQCVESGEPTQYEFKLRQQTDNSWWLRSIFPMVNLEGRVYRLIGTATPITGIKQAEQEKRRLESQLRQAQKMEAIGTLAGGIAHDFNNILSAIIGYTELSQEELPPGHLVTEYLNQVLKAGSRARNLVRQILSFSRPGDQELGPLNLMPVVKEAMKLMRSSLPSTIEIRLELEKPVPPVNADPTQIHQLITNLVTNASHAMEDFGGELEVGLAPVRFKPGQSLPSPDLVPGDFVHLWVRDSGHGMDSPTLSRVFDPFFTTKETGRGTGMGLAVVHGIVKSHGGAITADSQVGEGATFQVYLPSLPDQHIEGKAPEDSPVPTGSEKVLWVDDEPALADVGCKILQHLGYRVASFTSSLDALEAFRAEPHDFDLVITDYTMPKMTGGDLAREILKIRPELPIIICTGYTEQITEAFTSEIGIKRVMMKPLVAREVGEMIREALQN